MQSYTQQAKREKQGEMDGKTTRTKIINNATLTEDDMQQQEKENLTFTKFISIQLRSATERNLQITHNREKWGKFKEKDNVTYEDHLQRDTG
ncbi:hypothetical protein CDAR_4201 [Caerostris darwini]|uniref:Uncharacterized protein n=1 Tax=Caerostris darwini TaxID=1538125 RepID=A0AAV4N5U7_9ARAC|nr:hypothetical protein CDAR_4201 [Caerostris darwini]